MTEAELEAYLPALDAFKLQQEAAELENFSVKVVDRGEHFEVAFVPKKISAEGHEGLIQISVGGQNAFGKEVHYIVSKKNAKVTRFFFAR